MQVFLRWLPAVSIAALIFYLSSLPGLRVFPWRAPYWYERWLGSFSYRIGSTGFFSYVFTLQPEFVVRKLGHFFIFGLLGAALYYAVGQSKRKAIILSVLFAIFDEIHQGLVPGRDARLGDIILDTIGAAVFIGVCSILRRRSAHSAEDKFRE